MRVHAVFRFISVAALSLRTQLVHRTSSMNGGQEAKWASVCGPLDRGDLHQADHMPYLLAGKGGGTLNPGQVLDFLEEDDSNRRACSLYLSLMDRMGVQLPQFGDTTHRLKYI